MFRHVIVLLSCAILAVLASVEQQQAVDAANAGLNTVLGPDVHPDTDTSDLKHLSLQKHIRLYYSSSKSVAISISSTLIDRRSRISECHGGVAKCYP